ncbi:MAG TPA: sigma-70 family RNA polymerase sigma factor, partial [Urbifossiella sp.]|nr:sigma-70 family RNA polymerase sigma factor [Urbifossiella sp.]
MTDPAVLLRQVAAESAADADLLRRFATARDGAAFAELVRRHGPVVLAACRRGVRHHHDADDAFQAVFLVLARRAGEVRRPEQLGNWLYRVAVRIARRARRTAARRRVREVQGVDVPEPVAPAVATPDDLGPVLDEELDALPAWYRDAVVLCDLRGQSRAEAAAALGIPLGTLASRLDAARKKLAARLVCRGVTLSVAAVLVEARAVAVPTSLLTKTCEMVSSWSGGGALPQSVLKLAQGGLSMRGVRLGGLLVLSLAAGAALAGLVGPPSATEKPDAPAAAAPAQPDVKPAREKVEQPAAGVGQPTLARKEDLPLRDARRLAWSPDGAMLAVSGTRPGRPVPADAFPAEESAALYVLPVDGRKLQAGVATLPEGAQVVGFSADGASALTEVAEPGLISGSSALQLWSAAAATPGGVKVTFVRVQKGPAFDLPDRATGFVAAGGPVVRFLVPEYAKDGITRVEVRGLNTRDGQATGPAPVLTGSFQAAALSPDGVKVAVLTTAGAVEVYGADGKRAWAGELTPPEARSGRFSYGYDYLSYARGGAVLLAARPFKRPAAFDAVTGTALPAFE